MTVVAAPARTGAGAAWRSGWRTFWADPQPVLWPALLGAAGWVLAWVLAWLLIGATMSGTVPCVRHVAGMTAASQCPTGSAGARLGVGFLVFLVLGQLFWATLVAAALRAGGLPVARRGAALGTAVVIGCALLVSFVLGPLGPLLVAVLGQFALVGVLRDGLGVGAALGASAMFGVRSPGRVLGFTGLALLTLIGGLLLGVVGIVPASAVLVLAQLALYPPGGRWPE